MFDQTNSPSLGKHILNVIASPSLVAAMFAVFSAVMLVMYGNLVSSFVVASPLAFVVMFAAILSMAIFLALATLKNRRRYDAVQADFLDANKQHKQELGYNGKLIDVALQGLSSVSGERLQIVRAVIAHARLNLHDPDFPAILELAVPAIIDPAAFRLGGYTPPGSTEPHVAVFFGAMGPLVPRIVRKINQLGVPIADNVMETVRGLEAKAGEDRPQLVTVRHQEA